MYDGNGNMFSASHHDESRSLSYDYANRLTKLIISPTVQNGGPDTLIFNYDHTPNRIEKREHGVSTFYLYEGINVSTEINENGITITKYVYAGEHVVKIDSAGALYYYHNDLLGSVRRVSDSLGVVVWQGDYFAFGEIDTTQSSPGFENTHKFTGKQFDNPANYYYYNARYYDPEIGRFFSTDPIPTGNSYAYTSNNPLKFVDPTGMYGMPPERLSILPPEGPLGFARGQGYGAISGRLYRQLYLSGALHPYRHNPAFMTALQIAREMGLSLSRNALLTAMRSIIKNSISVSGLQEEVDYLLGETEITMSDVMEQVKWIRETFPFLDKIIKRRDFDWEISKIMNKPAQTNRETFLWIVTGHVTKINYKLANKDWALREIIAHELVETYYIYFWGLDYSYPSAYPAHIMANRWVNFYIGRFWER
jgi:RHS repeat-associated protein